MKLKERDMIRRIDVIGRINTYRISLVDKMVWGSRLDDTLFQPTMSDENMKDLPSTKIGDVEISKIVCGTNPFFGFSHFTRSRDLWMKEYFTDERIREVLGRTNDFGINAVLGGTAERLYNIIRELSKEGREIHFICTPGGSTADEVMKGVEWCADHGVSICMPHQMYTDHNLVSSRDDLLGYDEIAEMIRSLGMVPGLSTHRPETITSMDRSGKDVETYCLPFNSLGFLSNVEVEWVRKVIQSSPKPIISIKPLAAGRITPEVGLPFVLRSIKEKDAVALGFSNVLEVEEDMEIVSGITSDQREEIPLTTSRSKSIF
jgi:hypothetical protein